MPEKFAPAKGQWRPMEVADLTAVMMIAERVHPAFPEDAAVFAERLRLFSEGCLVGGADGAVVAAYMIGHPWRANDPPALNSRLELLPAKPSTYYLHDIAVLPELRGRGLASSAIELAVAQAAAERLPGVSLVALNGTASFWRHHGFDEVATSPALTRKLRGYGANAAFMVRTL